MGIRGRWVRCVDHRGNDVRWFVHDYFVDTSRRVLLVAGAGFDPRSGAVAQLLRPVLGARLEALLIREERPDPAPALVTRAREQLEELTKLVPNSTVRAIQVFDADVTSAAARHVVAGRQAVDIVQKLALEGFTDVVVDFSALSVGISYPLTRALLERADHGGAAVNLHAMVTSCPLTDDRVRRLPSTFVGPVHGFQGRWGIDATARAAKLWLPQLRLGLRGMLEALYAMIRPDDVVPVLPFPAKDPRLGDTLIEHYAQEIESDWAVDPRNIIYAAEDDALDFYRSVLRLDDARRAVFAGTIGSLLVLSPLGSRVLALGGMLAAIERDLPVMYVESLGYEADFADLPPYGDKDFVHVWLSGDAYPAGA